jgi:hypothetical protein
LLIWLVLLRSRRTLIRSGDWSSSSSRSITRSPATVRLRLLEDTPDPVGDERWDALFAGLAEHLAMRAGQAAPGWSATRGLRRFWFPFDTPGARAQALVHAPAAFRRRGVFVADYEIDAA